jgi:large subunit ribosomal protein L20
MPRVTIAPARKRRKKRVFKSAKGYRGARGNLYRTAVESVHKGWTYAFRDRRAKKRTYRSLWIARINAAVRPHGFSYSRFLNSLQKAKVTLNRKILAEIAVVDSKAFDQIVGVAKGKAARPSQGRAAEKV